MTLSNLTYRMIDGERIEGTWRSVFINNGGNYFSTDLLIFADGALRCWGDWTDLDGLRELLDRGRIVTTFKPGADVYAHDLTLWDVEHAAMGTNAEDLLTEVADAIDELNGRPDSIRRCRLALDRFLESRTEQDRTALRTAYLAVSEYWRPAVLPDPDVDDEPVRILCTPVGEVEDHGELVTESDHATALEYFARRPRLEPAVAQRPAVTLDRVPAEWPAPPTDICLHNEYPVPVTLDDRTYPSAGHAYWSRAVTNDDARARMAAEPFVFDAEKIAVAGPPRPDWPLIRMAAMHTVLRAKFTQHPQLAAVLLATGNARIDYPDDDAGRLLELIRSALAAAAAR
ncbi:NADAR family protein [Actinoplanes sp. NBRC 101535]|uniref:NADAR family protein n=1 Tax=Actinoplanes sp. NBRC 101535 TaxID=3032196 RepID=UPI0024A5BD53|nr:NADAR family protein [Actinoplanes sp. NBRC 101535]GLY03729.1 hypothetical protein Acsp01_41080 [Actinoplanes sp. NBRC 101535]